MADSKPALGPLEIEILRYIGDHHPISVGEVAEHVAQTTGQARTTVLTIMDRLRRKGLFDPKADRRRLPLFPQGPQAGTTSWLGEGLRGYDARRLGVPVRGVSFRERPDLRGRPEHC